MRFHLSVIIACLLAAFAPATRAADNLTIFSDLGVGGTYGPYQSVSGRVVAGSARNPGNSPAYSFTAGISAPLLQIDLGLSYVAGTNGAVVTLLSAVPWSVYVGPGFGTIGPGVQLGQWTVGQVPLASNNSATALTTISGIQGISLVAGTQYFLQVSPIASDTFLVWNGNTTGSTSTLSQCGGYNSTFTVCTVGIIEYANTSDGAFDILGPVSTYSTAPFNFGTATRVIQQGQGLNSVDVTGGDRNVSDSESYSFPSGTGTQVARADIQGYGQVFGVTAPSVGAWSVSSGGSGAARGIAFSNFINNTSSSIALTVNATLDGVFREAPYNPQLSGTASAGAAIHIFDATRFAAALNASGMGAAQFLLGQYTFTTASDPIACFRDLDARLSSALLASQNVFPQPIPLGNFVQQVTAPVSTQLITIAPQQMFTVLFDVATSSTGTLGYSADADFLNTMAPAANLFTDANNNPVTGIAMVGSAPPAQPTAASISLTPPTTTNTVGGSQTVMANVVSSASGPLSGAIVQFSVTSGPNTGVVGGGQTDANGNASFTYTGNGGPGTDVIQANVGSVVSNTVQSIWDAAVTPPVGSTGFIVSQTPGPVRNNYSGFVGMEFTVGATPVSVSSLGRFIVSGNSASHLVKLVQANGTDVPNGSVTVSTSGATAGTYQYAALPSPVTLLAGTSYFLVSQETAGGDQWYDYGPVTATSVGSVVGPTYTDSFGHYIAVTTLPGRSYVPVSFLYAPPTTSLAVSITSPTASATISGIASIAVTTTGSVASLQVKVDGNAQGSPVPVSVNQGPNYTLSLDTTVLSIGTHSLTVMASDAFGNTITSAAVSVTVSNSPGGSTPFVVSQTPGSLRNNYTGFVGLALNVGSTPVVVTSLGRFAMMGNSGTHLLKLVNSNGTDVPGGSVSVSMAGSTPGTFQYASLPAGPFTLQANTSYYLVSQETAGGDMWHDYGSVTTSVVASVPGPVYTDSLNHYVTVGGLGGESYVPVSFLYGPTANTISAAITSPQSGALLSGKSVSVAVSTTGAVTSLQLQVDGLNQGAAVSASPLTLDTTSLTNGPHTLTVVASQGSVASAVSPGVSVTVDNGGSTPVSFTTGQTPSTLRNNFTGYVGMAIQVGSTPLSVTSLGRYVASGDSGTHSVKLVQANGTDVAGGSVSLSLSGVTAGQFVYATLANPVALLANTTYYLVSQETSGGDKWYDLEPITTTGVGKVTGPTYVDGLGHYVTVSGYPGYSYVPVSFLYQ